MFALQKPSFLLLGDSLTERGYHDGGWAVKLSQAYSRKADVLHRGYGGFNTRWMREVLPDLLSTLPKGGRRGLATVWLGANDAAVHDGPSSLQHVPLSEYKDNLRAIVQQLKAGPYAHAAVILLTPPPVHDAGRKAWQAVKTDEATAASMPLDRHNAHTAHYVAACMEAAQEMGVSCVDLYHRMQAPVASQGWEHRFFNDGLHLTPEGNQEAFNALMDTIQVKHPELMPEALPQQLPLWDWCANHSLDELRSALAQARSAEQQ